MVAADPTQIEHFGFTYRAIDPDRADRHASLTEMSTFYENHQVTIDSQDLAKPLLLAAPSD